MPEQTKATDIYFQRIENEPYFHGETLFSKIRKIAMRPDWSLEEFFAAFDPWAHALIEKADEQGKCDGNLLDFTPFNIIVSEDGSLHAFDLEWISKNRLPVTFPLYRGFVNTLLRMLTLRKSPKHDIYSFNEMFQKFAERLKLPSAWPVSMDYVLWQELKFMRFIKGNQDFNVAKDFKIYYMP